MILYPKENKLIVGTNSLLGINLKTNQKWFVKDCVSVTYGSEVDIQLFIVLLSNDFADESPFSVVVNATDAMKFFYCYPNDSREIIANVDSMLEVIKQELGIEFNFASMINNINTPADEADSNFRPDDQYAAPEVNE